MNPEIVFVDHRQPGACYVHHFSAGGSTWPNYCHLFPKQSESTNETLEAEYWRPTLNSVCASSRQDSRSSFGTSRTKSVA